MCDREEARLNAIEDGKSSHASVTTGSFFRKSNSNLTPRHGGLFDSNRFIHLTINLTRPSCLSVCPWNLLDQSPMTIQALNY